MRRHASLEPFSRDHNTALTLARRLMATSEASESVRAEVTVQLVQAWKLELCDHFEEEERLLSSLAGSILAERLASEHRTIRSQVEELEGGGDAVDLVALGNLLHDHIRWEERELFVAIEVSTNEADHELLAAETEKMERRRWSSGLAPRRQELVEKRLSQQKLGNDS